MPDVSQNIVLHASPTARNSAFLVSAFPVMHTDTLDQIGFGQRLMPLVWHTETTFSLSLSLSLSLSRSLSLSLSAYTPEIYRIHSKSSKRSIYHVCVLVSTYSCTKLLKLNITFFETCRHFFLLREKKISSFEHILKLMI